MALIEELSPERIRHCLAEAVSRRIPVAMTCRIGSLWHNLYTAILKKDGDLLRLAPPSGKDSPPPAITKGLMLGLAFKLGHHKHIFNAPVESLDRIGPDEIEILRARRGSSKNLQALHAVCVPAPFRMQRVQRRAYNRVDIPKSRSVLATFWLGGRQGDRAVRWEGWVMNISAGGFQVRMPNRAAPSPNDGDVVGVLMTLGDGYEPVLADAQFRHRLDDDRGVAMLGFQFVGLNESASGRRTLNRIGLIVRGFQRFQGRRRAGGAA